MALGISFGKNKQKIDQTTTTKGREELNQTTNGMTASSGVTTGSSVTQGSQSAQGTSNTQSSQQSNQTQNTNQSGVSTTTSFSDSVLVGLEEQVLGMLNGGNQVGSYETTFDPDSYIKGVMGAAESKAQHGLNQGVNNVFSSVGGRQNSMSQLLAGQLANDAAAALGGVRSQAEATAAEILRQDYLANAQGSVADQGFLANLIGALRGGTSTTTTSQAGTTDTSGTQTGSQATQTAEQAQNAQTQMTEQIQNLVEIVNQVVNGIKNIDTTERTKGSTTKSGGGIGLSL